MQGRHGTAIEPLPRSAGRGASGRSKWSTREQADGAHQGDEV